MVFLLYTPTLALTSFLQSWAGTSLLTTGFHTDNSMLRAPSAWESCLLSGPRLINPSRLLKTPLRTLSQSAKLPTGLKLVVRPLTRRHLPLFSARHPTSTTTPPSTLLPRPTAPTRSTSSVWVSQPTASWVRRADFSII